MLKFVVFIFVSLLSMQCVEMRNITEEYLIGSTYFAVSSDGSLPTDSTPIIYFKDEKNCVVSQFESEFDVEYYIERNTIKLQSVNHNFHKIFTYKNENYLQDENSMYWNKITRF